MKKCIILAILFLSCGASLLASSGLTSSGQLQSNFAQYYGSYCRMEYGAEPRDYFARSFMFPRPLWLNLSTQQAMWYNMIYDKNGDIGLLRKSPALICTLAPIAPLINIFYCPVKMFYW